MFVHGVGGPQATDDWLHALNEALAQQQIPRLEDGIDRVITPTYLNEMRLGSTKDLPDWTWRKPDDRQYLDAPRPDSDLD